jgi:primase-polymerase (primpol)-like protein
MTPITFYRGPTAEDLARIPPILKALPQWILWCWEDVVDTKTGEIKANKTPMNARTLARASTTDPHTWAPFPHCVAALPAALQHWEQDTSRGYHGGGLGFVFTADDPYTGVDLDKSRDPKTGTLVAWAQGIIDILATYTEISPSGTGVKLWTRGTLPPTGRKKGDIEMYSAARYFTVTGQHLPGTPRFITERQDTLTQVHRTTFGLPQTATPVCPSAPSGALLTLDDATLVQKARTAKNGGKFDALWSGDLAGYPSPSNADLALCDLLAFWTQDPGQLDRLFRQSGLMRDKWDERHGAQTYGAMTIGKALSLQTEHYQGASQPGQAVAAPPIFQRRQAARIAQYKRQLAADPYFGASENRGKGIPVATLLYTTAKEKSHE